MTDSSRPWVSVVVPVKDELDNLTPLTERVLSVLQAREETKTAPFEVVFVDDGSTDGSSELLDKLASQHPQLVILHFDRNYGKTAAMDAGFRRACGALVATIDGDLQNDPADIGTLLPYTQHFDLVCGWRVDRHDNLVRRVSSLIGNAVRRLMTGDGIHDTGCGLRIFRRAVVEKLQLFEGMHRFFPALVLMHGFTITEVPVRHHPRLHGVTKYGVGNRLFKGLYDLIAVRWMQSRVLRYRIDRRVGHA